jgi:cell division protein FtsN
MTYSRDPSERNAGARSQSTLFGLILGLIVGLAIAVLAALYITHSPKPLPRKTETAPSSAPKLDDIGKLELHLREVPPSDEKTALHPAEESHIREHTEELEKPSIMEVPSRAPSAPTSSVPRPAPQPPQVAKPTESNSPSKTASINTVYYLQTGAYKARAAAEQQHARLALSGFSSKITQRTSGSVVYYRVRLGPFTQLSDMNAVRAQLSQSGIDALLIQEAS